MTTTTKPLTEIVKSATVRDLITLVTYGNTRYVQQQARRELTARGLCGNCGSGNHTYCNR